jgi:hypothetical protein
MSLFNSAVDQREDKTTEETDEDGIKNDRAPVLHF